jgi:hypothetical protein
MRINDLLLESKLSLLEGKMDNSEWMKPKYVQNLIIGLGEEQPYTFDYPAGQKTTGIIQNPNQVKKAMVDATNAGAVYFKNAKIKVSIEVVDKESFEPTGEIIDNVPINLMFKDEKILGFLKPNMGNVSEALLGCAVAAKFVSGGNPVTEQQAIEIGKQLVSSEGQLEAMAGKDKLYFKVSIPKMDNKAFKAWLGMDSRKKTLQDYKVPNDTIKLFDRRLKAAVDYANTSKRVMSAVQDAQKDPRNNKVDVISDGGEKENQNTTKVDLKILIDGEETSKRLLSVKAGDVAQFGQVVGSNFAHVSEFFNSFGVPLNPAVKKYFYEIAKGARGAETAAEKLHNFENGMSMAYSDAFKKLSAKAKSDPAGLVEDVYQGLLQHLTRKEEGVEMVILDPDDKKAFRELSFGEDFEKAMRQLQLVVVENTEGKAHIISIYGYPIGSIAKKFVPAGRKDASNKLVDLKSQFKDGTVRNMTAMGSLLKDVADIENYIEKQVDQQPVTPAVAKAVQPVAKVAPATKTAAAPATTSLAPQRTPSPATRTMPPTPDELDQIKRNAGIKKTFKV